ncbi:MAG: DUF1217 domain-containing protein [Pseudomonadota bacterium]
MSFQPVVPLGGYAGWTFLTRTLEAQSAAFSAAPLNERDTAYFRQNISTISSAADLVEDFQLLRVALGAFGLQEDQPNRAFIRTILDEGTSDNAALANRLADKRYRAFSEAFGFGESTPPKTQQAGFADRILARFERQEFERAVGEQDDSMRLALNLQRELPELAARGLTADTNWLSILGSPPLREVFETALGLPEGFGLIDLDQQVEQIRSRARVVLGTDDVATLARADQTDGVLRNFFGRAQIEGLTGAATPAAIALTLLQEIA